MSSRDSLRQDRPRWVKCIRCDGAGCARCNWKGGWDKPMTAEQIAAVEEWDALGRIIESAQTEKREVYKRCRDLGLDFVLHESGQDRWRRDIHGDWRPL